MVADPVGMVKTRMQHAMISVVDTCFHPKLTMKRGGQDASVIDNVLIDYNAIRKNVLDLFEKCGIRSGKIAR